MKKSRNVRPQSFVAKYFSVDHAYSMITFNESPEFSAAVTLYCCRSIGRKGIRPVEVLPQQFPRVYLCGLA